MTQAHTPAHHAQDSPHQRCTFTGLRHLQNPCNTHTHCGMQGLHHQRTNRSMGRQPKLAKKKKAHHEHIRSTINRTISPMSKLNIVNSFSTFHEILRKNKNAPQTEIFLGFLQLGVSSPKLRTCKISIRGCAEQSDKRVRSKCPFASLATRLLAQDRKYLLSKLTHNELQAFST